VKPVLLRRILAATVFIAPLSHAADEAAKPAAAAQPVMFQAFAAAVQEMRQAYDQDAHPNAYFEKMLTFQHSPETMQLIVEAFGTDRPWGLEKVGVEQGKTHWRSPLFALRRTTPSGGTVEWSELTSDVLVDQAGKTLEFRAAWPSFSYEDKDALITLRDGALAGTNRRSGKLWYGNMEGSLASVEVAGKTKPLSMAMRDLRFASKVEERPRTVQMTQTFGIKAIEFAGERIDDFTIAMRVANLEKAALVAMQEAEKKLGAKQVATRDDLSAMMPLFKTMLRGAAKYKTALLVDEMSFAYHGHKAMLKGRVGLDGVREADLADMAKVAKRVQARVEIKVPLALVREVALTVARQQLAAAAAAGKAQAQPQDLAKVAQSVTDAVVGKLLGNGYARLQNDMLVSTIEFRDGVLRVNGKKIDLPKPAKAPAPGAANYMQSRRITDSCTLPDYPAQVVEKDAELALTLQYVVDPEGKLRDLQLAQPSGFTDFDGALLRAFNECRFIPALKDGKPVEQTVTQTFRREPGSTRP
jgi:TonB family protein